MVNPTADIELPTPATPTTMTGSMSPLEWAKAEMNATNSRIAKVKAERAATQEADNGRR